MKKVKKYYQKFKTGLTAGAIAISETPKVNVPQKTVDPMKIVVNVINYALLFIGAIAFIFVVWGGIQFVTSGGDSEKVAKARNTLLYAIVGVIVVVLAWGIVQWAGTGAFNTATK